MSKNEYDDPAVALLELRSIARGVKTADAMVKKAPVRLLEARTVCPGKYIILIGGETQAVQDSYNEGSQIGAEMIVDELFLPHAHHQLMPAMQACTQVGEIDSLAILETFTVASVILSADAAAKAADIQLIELRMANGLGGKSFFTMTGPLPDIEAAVEAGVAIMEAAGTLVCVETVPNPHADINLKLL
ncbi:MAG: BMC domain-containing protein [Nitrospinota bacterium]|nr:BMC domain-containing protein [Nitrospinota bacterium]MDH5679440.1 BMC domain-containing protein [Nitrospinota bacterium]MDH5756497.1 BMC domain-containing protein [Nitrospinota bacterium]